MPYAEMEEIRLYYEENGEGEPLLLLHGALGAVEPAVMSGWHALRPALTVRYRTISLETRGHGRTGNLLGSLSYARMAADVASFIAAMTAPPVHLAGFSDGATIRLVLGEADFALSLGQMLEMRRAIPHAEMLILNHAPMDGVDNHRVQATRADVVGPVMLEFLGRHGEVRAAR